MGDGNEGCGCFGAVVVVLLVGTLVYCSRVPEDERGFGSWMLAVVVVLAIGVILAILRFIVGRSD